MTVSVSRNFLE